MKTIGALLVVAACGSSSPPCSTDHDCSGGTVCEVRDTTTTCVPAAEAPIAIGMTAPLSGTDQGRGLDMQRGIAAAVDSQNASGGMGGRQLQLLSFDNGGDLASAEHDARTMADAQVGTEAPRCPSTVTPYPDEQGGTSPISSTALTRGPAAVLAMLGTSGSQSLIVRAGAVAVETGTLYFGAASGGVTFLRDNAAGDCARYIYNFRASFADEALATAKLFQERGVPSYTNLLSFDQNDLLGDSGYTALLAAYPVVFGGQLPSGSAIMRVRYTRNDDTSVPTAAHDAEAYITQLLATQTGMVRVGIMMTDTYGASASFIQELRQWQFAASADQTQYQMATRLDLTFSNMSYSLPDALSDRLVASGNVMTPSGLQPLTTAVYVTQVVPNYQTDASPLVVAFRQEVTPPSFTALEGYLVTEAFIAGLAHHDGPFTPDRLAGGFDAVTPTVWGISIQADGSFRSEYTWTAGPGGGTFTPSP